MNNPFCGSATFDGHKGTDIRIRFMAEIADNVAVLAATDGKIINAQRSQLEIN